MNLGTPSVLDRDGWNELCNRLRGPEVEDMRVQASITDGHADVEFEWSGGHSQVDVWVHENATDVRVGSLVQLIVGRGHAALLVAEGPYPLKKWLLLWEGDL